MAFTEQVECSTWNIFKRRGNGLMILEKNLFKQIFAECGFEISDIQYNKFGRYAGMLAEWNEKINLTAITDPYGISVKHFLDSIIILKNANIKENSNIIDVGTGAGFPAIPLKIYRDDLNMTALDSLNKRVSFLKLVSDKLELPIECVHSRAEDGGRNPALREKFDYAIARAVAPLPVLCEYCLPFVKAGGAFLAMKGPNEDYSSAETALKLLGGEIADVFNYNLPNGDPRLLIVVGKENSTPEKYPRSSSQISKNML